MLLDLQYALFQESVQIWSAALQDTQGEHLQAVYERKLEVLLGLLQDAGRWDDALEWAERWIALGQKPEADR